MRGPEQRGGVLVRAVARGDLFVVAHIIARILERRIKAGVDPQGIAAQVPDVVEFGNNALQITDAVAVGIHITGVLQNGGGSSGIKLRLTDVGSGKVTVNGADRRVHRRCSAGHGHVYQSLTVAAGGQSLTNIHILQQFVALREGDERIAKGANRFDLIVGVALQLRNGRCAEEVGTDIDLAVLQGQHHSILVGVHAEYHFINAGSGTVIGLSEIGVALQSDIFAVHPLGNIVGTVTSAGVRIGSGLFHRGPLALTHHGYPVAGALPEVHVSGSQSKFHGALIRAGGLFKIHQTIVAVEEAM